MVLGAAVGVGSGGGGCGEGAGGEGGCSWVSARGRGSFAVGLDGCAIVRERRVRERKIDGEGEGGCAIWWLSLTVCEGEGEGG